MALTRVREYQVDTSIMGVDDAITTLNESQTGANSTDIGFVMDRGTSGNVAFIWNELNNLFRLIYTTDSGKEQNSNVTNVGNAPLMTGTQYISEGNFTMEGDAKAGVYIQRNETVDNILTPLFINGVNANLVVAPNSVWTYEIMLSAKRIDAGGDAASFKITGAIGRDASLSSVYLVGTPSKTIVGRTDTGWDAQVQADTSTGALVVKVHGSSGKTVRWVAKIMTLEVAFN